MSREQKSSSNITEILYSSKTQRIFWKKVVISEVLRPVLKKGAKNRIMINNVEKGHPILGIGYSFEHSSCANLMILPEEKRRTLLRQLLKPIEGLGFNLWRICIGTSDFTGTPWYSYCDSPPKPEEDEKSHLDSHFSIDKDLEFIIPTLKEALLINPELLLFASPWSPPGWMKNSGTMLGGRLLPKYYDVYAEYFIKFIKAYSKEGISIHAITVQNEPLHNTKDMPTCHWRGKEERDFIKNHLGPRLLTLDLKMRPEIWCYDHNWEDFKPKFPAKYPQIILDSPEAKKFVSGIGFHHYSNFFGRFRGNPSQMVFFRKKYPEIPLYFTEGSVFGLRGATRLCRYFKYGASSYNGWVPFLDKNGKPNNGPFHASNTFIQLDREKNEIRYNFDYYMYGHFSKFMRPGTRVVQTEGKMRKGCEYLVLSNQSTRYLNIICVNSRDSNQLFDICLTKLGYQINVPSKSILTLQWDY